MIHINLLKRQYKKKFILWKFSTRQLFIIGYTTGALVICTTGLVIIKGIFFSNPKITNEYIIKDDYSPSTFVKSNAVEEVVRDVNDLNDKISKRGLLDLPYEQLSFLEKINYEINFAKNICDLLHNTFIPGVDFRNLQINSFKSFGGDGLSKSKENVIKVFNALKQEKVEILPKPETSITKKENIYYFKISCITEFGLDLEAPFLLGYDEVLADNDLSIIIQKILVVAEEKKITVSSDPTLYKSNVIGDYKRFKYHFSGTSSYSDFVAFINSLYDRHIPCAFESFKLKALEQELLSFEAKILLTTSN
ncbi:MAG: hypothetical protein PVI26_09080 [Chitinispirillia bacterium]|jgi:hypothetical protein